MHCNKLLQTCLNDTYPGTASRYRIVQANRDKSSCHAVSLHMNKCHVYVLYVYVTDRSDCYTTKAKKLKCQELIKKIDNHISRTLLSFCNLHFWNFLHKISSFAKYISYLCLLWNSAVQDIQAGAQHCMLFMTYADE